MAGITEESAGIAAEMSGQAQRMQNYAGEPTAVINGA